MKIPFNQTLRALPVLLALCLLQVCLTRPIAGKGAYPVKWLDGYDLYQYVKGGKKPRSLADFPRHLESRWEDHFKLLKEDRSLDREVNTCSQYFAARNAGAEPPSVKQERINYSWMAIDCLATRIIMAGKEAKKSHIEKLPLDGRLAKFLPAAVKYRVRANAPVPKKGSWADVERGLKVTEVGNYGSAYTSKGVKHAIWLMATGDFNDDGTNDILLRIRHRIVNAQHFSDNLYVMTRFSEKDILKIVSQYSMYK